MRRLATIALGFVIVVVFMVGHGFPFLAKMGLLAVAFGAWFALLRDERR